ncbi:MAG: DUF2231 domain-containing protein [Methyloversatilis sp.]|nr:DUF2231 domain-containing protein [Methyloversatilis sp.]
MTAPLPPAPPIDTRHHAPDATLPDGTPDHLPSGSPEPIHSLAALGKHPLHPMLIHLPVAALIGLVATDLAWLYTRDPFWMRAGIWLAGVGAGGGWLASAVGLLDLLAVRRIREKISAWAHALAAVMLLSLATCNWLLRFAGEHARQPETALALSLGSAAATGLAAWLGGRLVYEHAVGVAHRIAPAEDH